LISADCNVNFSEVIDVCREKSDHNATKISLQIPNYLQKTYQRTIWMYKNEDFEKFDKLITFNILLKELLFSTNKSIFRSPVIMTFVV
jgi:hypothetical protein